MSVHKLYRDMKSQGISLSKDTLYEYIEYLHEAYIIFPVVKYSQSVRVQTQNPSKYYVIDTGLMQPFVPDTRQDWGKKLENAVYLHLRINRQNEDIYYFKNKFEIDFVYNFKNDLYMMNVAFEVNDTLTAERERSGLLEGKQHFPDARTGLILNDWQPALIPNHIQVLPAWRFLIGEA